MKSVYLHTYIGQLFKVSLLQCARGRIRNGGRRCCVFVEGRLARTRNNDQHTQQRPWGRNERDIFVGELEPCIFERYADIVELGKSRVTSVAGSVVLP